MQRRVSMKDIANKVGVSIALVSYVLNGQEKEKRVGAEVVRKIQSSSRGIKLSAQSDSQESEDEFDQNHWFGGC